MDFIPAYLREINIASIIARFILTGICCGVIGISRGKKQHAAGLRTHLLVGVGAACVMMINQYTFQYMGWGGDIGRMGAQVVSGIGFLGAGTILVTGRRHIRGLTSAAGLWASACMRLAAGIGFYKAAAIMCAVIFIILSVLDRFDENYIKKSREITVYVECASDMPLSNVIKCVRAEDWHLNGMEQINLKNGTINAFTLNLEVKRAGAKTETVIEKLESTEGVYFVEIM